MNRDQTCVQNGHKEEASASATFAFEFVFDMFFIWIFVLNLSVFAFVGLTKMDQIHSFGQLSWKLFITNARFCFADTLRRGL